MNRSIQIALVLIFLIILIGAVLGYAERAQLLTQGQVTLIFSCLTLVGVVAGTAIAYTQLRFAAEQIQLAVERAEAERKKNRQDGALAYSLMYYPQLLDAFQRLEIAFPPAGQPSVISITDLNESHRMDLQKIFAHWENLALTIKYGTTDEDMAFDMSGQGLVRFCRQFKALIVWRQSINSRAYMNLERLVTLWGERITRESAQLSTSQPPEVHGVADPRGK